MDALAAFEMLVRLETRLWNDLDRVLVRDGHPSLAWLGVLRIVEVTPDCRIGDVSRGLEVTHGGLSKLADRIVAAGLLDRTDHPTDRRARVLVLTPQGRATLTGAEAAAEAWLVPRLGDVEAHRSLQAHLTAARTQLEETP